MRSPSPPAPLSFATHTPAYTIFAHTSFSLPLESVHSEVCVIWESSCACRRVDAGSCSVPCKVPKCDDPSLQSAPHCGMCEATAWMSCTHAWGCYVSVHVCDQQRDGVGGAFLRQCARLARPERAEMSHDSPPLFSSCCPPQSAMHTVVATNAQTLPHHALHTLHKHQDTHARTSAGKGGGDGGLVTLVAGSTTKMRHRFLRKTHAHDFRGVVCIYIQSPKHLESLVDVFPHHQA